MKGYDSCSLLLEENLYKTFTTRINIHQVLLMQTCRQGLNAGRIRHLRRQRHCRIATQKQDPAPVLWGHHPAPMPTTGSPLSAPKGKCYRRRDPSPPVRLQGHRVEPAETQGADPPERCLSLGLGLPRPCRSRGRGGLHCTKFQYTSIILYYGGHQLQHFNIPHMKI